MLKVLDKNTEELLAYLENAKNVAVQEKLNGEFLLTFWVPRTDPKWQYIETENYIDCEGQLFVIRTTEEEHDSSGRLTANVQCEHVYTELIDEYQDQLINFAGTTAMFALTQILQNTRFTIGTVSDFGLNDLFDLGETNKLDCVGTVQDVWGGEFKWDNRQLNLLAQRGADNGVQFRYRKNLKGIKRTTDSKNLITRLYGYGKDGLTIEGINTSAWSQEEKDRLLVGVTLDANGIITAKSIDSQYISNYPRPKNGKQEFNDIDDQVKLLEEMQKYLRANEVPKVTYDVDFIELKKLGYKFEDVALGDTVTAIDEPLEANIKARIYEYEYYPYEADRSKVRLANFRENINDLLGEFQSSKELVDKSKDAWDRARQFDTDGYLSTQWLIGAIAAATNQINAGTNNCVEINGDGVTIYDPTDQLKLKRIRINHDAIGLSVDGGATYRNAMTSSGIVADLITAGKILTSIVRIEGDSNFYWDAVGLYAIDPADPNRLIRFNKDGLRVTANGGVTWDVAIDYNGVTVGGIGGAGDIVQVTKDMLKASHDDGSFTQIDADGIMRVIAGENNPYFYLWEYQQLAHPDPKSFLWSDNYSDGSWDDPAGWYLWSKEECDQKLPPVTVQLPAAFKGKQFRVFPTGRFGYQSELAIERMFMTTANTGWSDLWYDYRVCVIEVVPNSYDYVNATFQVRAYTHVKFYGSDSSWRSQRRQYLTSIDFDVLVTY